MHILQKKKFTAYLTFKKYYSLLLRAFFSLSSILFFNSILLGQKNSERLNSEIYLSNSDASDVLADLQKAIELTDFGSYLEARPIFQKLDTSQLLLSNDSLRMAMLESRAFMNKVLKRYDKSLEDLLEMLEHYSDSEDYNNIAKTETLLAEFYRARDLKELAFRHLSIAENIIENHFVEPCNIAYWFSRRAACETQFQPDTDNIVFFCKKGLELSTSNCAKYTEALIYNELGFTYGHSEFDNEEKIISQYRESLDILLEINRMRDVATIRHNLATYYTRRGYLEDALDELNPTIELAESNKWYGALEDLYLLKMTILNSQGKYKEAYELSRVAYGAKVELMRSQYTIDVEEIQAVHDRELAEEALEQAEVRAETNEQALVYTIMGTSLLALSTITSILLFLRVRGKNRLLNDQQSAIELTNHELSNSLNEKEVLYKELNHRVKNNLMVLSGLIYLQQKADKSDQNEALYTALRNRIQTMAIVHEKLYGINSSININFQEYLEELVPLIYNSFRKDDVIMPYTIRCMTLFLPIHNAIPLALIFNELITNSIKHANSRGLEQGIVIEAETKGDEFTIQYQDFGEGLPLDFDLEKSTSMGMKIVNLMSQQLKATPVFTSSDEGLRFTITFS